MKPNLTKICDAARSYCGVSSADHPDSQAIVDWKELSAILQISPKACQIDVSNNPLWLVQNPRNLRFVMASLPPDEFAVLRTTVDEIIRYRDREEIPDIWILTVEQYSELRAKGPLMWERFVHLKSRYPNCDDIQNGVLGLDAPTRARFFPVCIDVRWLRVRMTIRRLVCSIQRSNAVNRRWEYVLTDSNFH